MRKNQKKLLIDFLISPKKYFLFLLLRSTETPRGPNDLCPRLNGFYAHPDPAICNVFYACVDGKPEEYVCSPGLWFDEYKGVCNWPAETDRQNCQAGKLSGKHFYCFMFWFNSFNCTAIFDFHLSDRNKALWFDAPTDYLKPIREHYFIIVLFHYNKICLWHWPLKISHKSLPSSTSIWMWKSCSHNIISI